MVTSAFVYPRHVSWIFNEIQRKIISGSALTFIVTVFQEELTDLAAEPECTTLLITRPIVSQFNHVTSASGYPPTFSAFQVDIAQDVSNKELRVLQGFFMVFLSSHRQMPQIKPRPNFSSSLSCRSSYVADVYQRSPQDTVLFQPTVLTLRKNWTCLGLWMHHAVIFKAPRCSCGVDSNSPVMCSSL
jgi:hypothetical protein